MKKEISSVFDTIATSPPKKTRRLWRQLDAEKTHQNNLEPTLSPTQSLKPLNFKTLKLPKFKTCENQLLVRLRPEQAEYLSRLESAIMKGRSKPNKKERITKNTIIRTAIALIQSIELDPQEIANEEALLDRIKNLLKPPSLRV